LPVLSLGSPWRKNNEPKYRQGILKLLWVFETTGVKKNTTGVQRNAALVWEAYKHAEMETTV
jgi:hypothetical protein